MRKQILFVLFSLATLSIHADEGMWMLTDLKTQNAVAMRELGLEIPIEEVYDANGLSLKDAVVHFGGGCTGEIISSEGLVLTNHHCGYGAIQQHSNVEHDYLTDGFWAMNRDAELPTPGLTVTFIDRILDVTDYVNEQLKKDPDPEGVNYLSPSYLGTVAERFAKAENIEITPATKLELKAFFEETNIICSSKRCTVIFVWWALLLLPSANSAQIPTTGCGLVTQATFPFSVFMRTRTENRQNTQKITFLCR